MDTILFDLDGTLIHVELDFLRMKELVIQLARDFGVHDSTLDGMDILGVVETASSLLEAKGSGTDALRLKEESERLLSQIEIAASYSAAAIPGAVDLLVALRSKAIKTAIVTRNCRSAAEIALGRAGLSVPLMLTRSDVPRPKPDPDHLHRALALLNSTPRHALIVGDHWMDIQGGNAAGTRTAALLSPGRDEDWFRTAPPDLFLHSLEDLLLVIG